jgi:hypothetical protein
MAVLTADALWLQDTWQLRQVPLRILDSIEAARHGRELVLSFRPELSAERLRLTFAGANVGQRWHQELQARQQRLPPEAPPGDRAVPEGVALVQRAPPVPHAVLDRVTFTGPTPWAADRGLQLRAGMRGADAVLGVERQKCPELVWGARCVSGMAVRVADAADRQRLRLRWYREEVGALVNRLLLLLALQAAAVIVVGVFLAGRTPLHPATGATLPEALQARTAEPWRPAAPTARCASGTPRAAGNARCLAATARRSPPLPTVLTARSWPPAAAPRRACGTPRAAGR